MKNQLRSIALAFGLSAIIGGTHLIAADFSETGKIPFEFQIDAERMPAGTYAAEWMQSPHVIALRNVRTGQAKFLPTGGSTFGTAGEAKLVFHKYGNRLFLSEVWYADGMGRMLPKSKAEKELAANSGKPQVVYLAMR